MEFYFHVIVYISDASNCEVGWSKDGKKLKKKKGKLSLSEDAGVLQLIINQCSVSDSGEYTINVSNSAGKIEASVSVVVKAIEEAPKITHLPESFSVKPGQNIKISCNIQGKNIELHYISIKNKDTYRKIFF